MRSDSGARPAFEWWLRGAQTWRNSKKLHLQIRAAGGEAFVVSIDLASAESIKEAFAAAKEFGRIDILVNNAGITRDGLALRMKKDDWDAVLAANLTGAFLASSRCCKE